MNKVLITKLWTSIYHRTEIFVCLGIATALLWTSRILLYLHAFILSIEIVQIKDMTNSHDMIVWQPLQGCVFLTLSIWLYSMTILLALSPPSLCFKFPISCVLTEVSLETVKNLTSDWRGHSSNFLSHGLLHPMYSILRSVPNFKVIWVIHILELFLFLIDSCLAK